MLRNISGVFLLLSANLFYIKTAILKLRRKNLNLAEILFLGLALAVDVFGISFAYGLIIRRHRLYLMLRLAFVCGVMQTVMPVTGYFAAAAIRDIIAHFNYLLVFLIFTGLGLNIIREAYNTNGTVKAHRLTLKTTLAIGFATSIDALVSGTMLYLTGTNIIISSVLIGLCSFVISLTGFNLNCCLQKIPEKYLQYLAGTILIALGLKNLLAHFYN